MRFKEGEIEQVIDKINSTGFGLTLGIHTRIERRAIELAKRSRAGNVYINRNMIGAVVGVQPFGGRGLSGTGPKAGGPMYLSRLVKERSTSKKNKFNFLSTKEITLTGDISTDKEANYLMEQAEKSENSWRWCELNTRISCVRQLLAKIAHVEIVDNLNVSIGTRTINSY